MIYLLFKDLIFSIKRNKKLMLDIVDTIQEK